MCKPRILGWALALIFTCGQASAIDLGIENQEDYDRLVSALRAAEYVRNDMIMGLGSPFGFAVDRTPKPRVYGALALLMAYAERNPNASDAQLEAFLLAFNPAVAAYAPDVCRQNNQVCLNVDQYLAEPSTFIAALSFMIFDDPVFVGTDTAIGPRALELLGITIPNPDSFESIERRMARYEVLLGRQLNYSNEVFDLLVTGFYGQDLAGRDRPTLPVILANYFKLESYDPEFGMVSVRADRANVNAGLAILPANYADYLLAISAPLDRDYTNGVDNSLQNHIFTQLGVIKGQIDSIVGLTGSLGVALDNAPGLEESVALGQNENNINALIAERRIELQAVAEARTTVSAATFLMLQREFDEIGPYAFASRDFSQISLETNEAAADMKAGVSIAMSLTAAAVAAYREDPVSRALAMSSVVDKTFTLVGRKLDDSKSVDQQTFEQVKQLRLQVEDMRREMNVRFDRIDQQLGTMYDTITAGFDGLGSQISDLGNQTNVLVKNMAGARSDLRRVENALYAVGQDVLELYLSLETDIALDYFDKFGTDLNYTDTDTSFISAITLLTNFATNQSKTVTFVKPLAESGLLNNAAATLQGLPASSFLNPLAVLPEIKYGLDPLTGSGLPGIEPWSQAASAYAQIARENPWYTGYYFATQIDRFEENPDGTMPDLDRIILAGEEIASFVEAIRELDGNYKSPLFDALTQDYRDAADALQAQIDAEIPDVLPAMLKGASTTLDLWAQAPQPSVTNLITSPLVTFEGDGSLPDLPMLVHPTTSKGFNSWAQCPCASPGEQTVFLQTFYLLRQAEESVTSVRDVTSRYRIFRPFFGADNWRAEFYAGHDGQKYPRILRRLEFNIEQFLLLDIFTGQGIWVDDDSSSVAGKFEDIWIGTPSRLRLYETFTRHYYGGPDVGHIDLSSGQGGGIWEIPDISRIIITSDSGESVSPLTASDIQPGLNKFRQRVRSHLQAELKDISSDLYQKASELDNIKALIDAYVSIGMSRELNRSEVLRSALRTEPSIVDLGGASFTYGSNSELGLGKNDVIALINDLELSDSGADWANPVANVNRIGEDLNKRIDIVEAEIFNGLSQTETVCSPFCNTVRFATPAHAPDYVGRVLGELQHLGDTTFKLAIDDTYVLEANGSLTVEAVADGKIGCPDVRWQTGLLGNDAKQGCNVISIDPTSVSDPEDGAVTVNPDGSFTYVADVGFSGSDSFSYRAMTIIDGDKVVLSNTAVVVITGEAVKPSTIFSSGFED
jgi:hypothetical protein